MQPELIQVGPDSCHIDLKYLPNNPEWVVYWFKTDGLDGSGSAYCKAGKDLYWSSLRTLMDHDYPFSTEMRWTRVPSEEYVALAKFILNEGNI
jgi:hypothetical protein